MQAFSEPSLYTLLVVFFLFGALQPQETQKEDKLEPLWNRMITSQAVVDLLETLRRNWEDKIKSPVQLEPFGCGHKTALFNYEAPKVINQILLILSNRRRVPILAASLYVAVRTHHL